MQLHFFNKVISMNVEQIKQLPKILRLIGYLSRSSKLSECGAKLRLAHIHEATDADERWTDEEEAEWDNLCDNVNPWWEALSNEEKILLKPLECFMACLCRGEDPEEHIKLTMELIGKYAKPAF